MKRLLLFALALLMVAMIAVPAGAITSGVPDNNEHPYVGQLFFYDPNYIDSRFTDPGGWFNCSGALISPTILVTAGHCTFGIGDTIWVNFDEVPSYEGLPPSADYIPDDNEQRFLDREAWLDGNTDAGRAWIRGTAYTHPDYVDSAFYLADLGVVVLEKAVRLDEYATLSEVGYFDSLSGGAIKSARFTPVGYGLNRSGPKVSEGGDTRQQANVMIKQINDVYVTFSANSGQPHEGGTCFGDSGGPIFLAETNQIVAVVSFGINTTCAGTGGGYRIDTVDDQAFILGF